MKKLCSLIKASMTSGMAIFKINTKKNSRLGKYLPYILALYLMFAFGMSANIYFEKVAPMHIGHILLAFIVFSVSVMTIMEGVYKTGPLLFDCKDDDLLLSLPIKRKTVLFIRILKFYIFELVFNSMFILPFMVVYTFWAPSISWTYYLTSIIMLLFLPIIPIIISSFIGLITSSITSKSKYKNFMQILLSMVFLLAIIYLSTNMDKIIEYIAKNASSLNDLLIKIYYPAGLYSKLITDFNVTDLLIFICINLVLLVISISLISKFYFKVNSRLKKVISNKKVSVSKLVIKSKPKYISLIKKELGTFFKTPVFIINSGFALVLFIIAIIAICIKFDGVVSILTNTEGLNITKDMITSNLSIYILILIIITAYMTSITNSVISLEGKNINILKALPIKEKTILISKILACMIITSPVLLIGTLALLIRFRIKIFESILLMLLAILIPLVSHFIGILFNLKYPKLDFESSAEVVKQSMSSFISVTAGMILLIVNIAILLKIINNYSSLALLIGTVLIYIIVDIILYICLIKYGRSKWMELSI